MSTIGVARSSTTSFAELRQKLKDDYRKANNLKSCSAEMKETKNSSFFGDSEYSFSQRLDALMPEMMSHLQKANNNDRHLLQKPSKETKAPKSGVDLKSPLRKGVDYSFLSSETTSEVQEVSKGSLLPEPVPKAVGNGIPKSHDKVPSLKPKASSLKSDKASCSRPKKSVDENTNSKVSLAKSESVSKEAVVVSGSQSLKPRLRENMVKRPQPKQAEVSDTKVMQEKEGPCLKRKPTKKRPVEEDFGGDDHVDRISSVIRGLFGRRGNREYKNHGDDGDDREMVVSRFADFEKMERRTALRGMKEDAIEAQRLEEEARKAKKRKLMNKI